MKKNIGNLNADEINRYIAEIGKKLYESWNLPSHLEGGYEG